MRNAILTMLLAVVTSDAAAEWVKLTGNEATIALYAEPAAIRKGNIVRIWFLLDAKTVRQSKSGDKRYRSSKVQYEYDCNEERWRTLYFSWHSENMGAGEIVYSDSDPGKWEPVPPDNVPPLWKVVCGKE